MANIKTLGTKIARPAVVINQEAHSVTAKGPEIVLCPGQGAQQIGMGKAWCDRFAIAHETFTAANEILGFQLSDVCFNGPEAQLNRTDIAQPAIYTTSVACYRALVDRGQLGPLIGSGRIKLGRIDGFASCWRIRF